MPYGDDLKQLNAYIPRKDKIRFKLYCEAHDVNMMKTMQDIMDWFVNQRGYDVIYPHRKGGVPLPWDTSGKDETHNRRARIYD